MTLELVSGVEANWQSGLENRAGEQDDKLDLDSAVLEEHGLHDDKLVKLDLDDAVLDENGLHDDEPVELGLAAPDRSWYCRRVARLLV